MGRFGIAKETLRIYTTAGVSMIVLGVLSMLIGIILVMADLSVKSSYRRRSTSTGTLGIISLFGGAALAFGARVPLQRMSEAKENYVELSDDSVTCLETGLKRCIRYFDVVDVTQTETSFILSTNGKGQITITNEYENFEEIVATIRAKCGRG